MTFFEKHRRRVHPATVALMLLLILLTNAPLASADSDYFNHFEAYFKAKIGYLDDVEFQFEPTMLNYVCFSHHLSCDFGILNDDEYVLYAGVSEQEVTDYIAYLNHFGYTVAFDAVQNDARYVELRDINAPSYMPQVFRFYYYPEDKALVTIEPRQVEEAFDAARKLHWQNFKSETLTTIKLLQPGISVSLNETRLVNKYLWADAAHPFCSYSFPSQIEQWIGSQRLESVSEDGSRMLVMKDEYTDAGTKMNYWFLQLAITSVDQPFHPDEWEFCIANDGLGVHFPYQVGNQLEETDDGPILSMDPTLYSGDICMLWLSFPARAENPDATSKLYIARAGEGTPIMDRVNFGFDTPKELGKDISWDSWDFSPGDGQ